MVVHPEKKSDTQFWEETIMDVRNEDDGYWAVQGDKGWWLGVHHESIVPHIGDIIRCYGPGFGHEVRGIDINGQTVRYSTEREMKEKWKQRNQEREEKERNTFEKNKGKYYARISALPIEYQRRMERFHRNNPDFPWKHGEYELFCCEESQKIAAYAKTEDGVNEFYKLPFEQQVELAGISDGHSGNTFGFSCRLAKLWLVRPDLIEQEHGALDVLVGCVEYGCFPKEENRPEKSKKEKVR